MEIAIDVHTYRSRSIDVLGEYNTLEFNDKEVDQLLDIFEQPLEGFAWNDVVTLRPYLRGKTISKSELSKDFDAGSD